MLSLSTGSIHPRVENDIPRCRVGLQPLSKRNEMNTYSLDYIDDLYVRYIQDPNSVSDVWKRYFEEFSLAAQSEALFAEQPEVSSKSESHSSEPAPDVLWLARMQERVDQLVREYRVRGHLMARIDPLGLTRKGPQSWIRSRMG